MVSFQEKVYKVVRKIPKGQVLTYAEVARAVGSPRAFRAVGNALNRNPDLINIPCHRVVRANSEIGGYRGGSKKKALLLKREGVMVIKGRVLP